MRFHRPARRIALGLGAAGIALGSGGLAIAATTLIQPAGALSVQVPAVAVREQNVNAAGRIRVALPKGTVNVGNLPVNSAGQLKVAPSAAASASTSHAAFLSQNVGTTSVTWVNVSGSGVFKGVGVGNNVSTCAVGLQVVIDGQDVFSDGITLAHDWFGNSSVLSGTHNNGSGGAGMQFWPRGGLPFQKSLQIVTEASCNTFTIGRAWYTTTS